MKCCGLCKHCLYIRGFEYICGATEINNDNCVVNVVEDLEKEGRDCEMFELDSYLEE